MLHGKNGNIMSFGNTYKNKKVLVTGNTGFKGSWLCTWLLELGADVYGISKDIPSTPSMHEALNLQEKISYIQTDIREYSQLERAINEIKPDFVFHLAAQAIVSTSYSNPLETLSTNIMGTANILEVFRKYENEVVLVLITSDKAYDNVEWLWGYKETDLLGGKDIYSGSKSGAELVIKSYWHSFLKNKSNVQLGIGRAGNVIGGGDWSKDRIIVDCVTNWNQNKPVELRCPDATRPWQHVLEPLSGYLALGQLLFNKQSQLNGEAFNFGPSYTKNHTVYEVACDLARNWGLVETDMVKITGNIPFHEAGLLKLNCEKAMIQLNWHATLDYFTTIKFVSDWYLSYYSSDANSTNTLEVTKNQIQEFERCAQKFNLEWAIN